MIEQSLRAHLQAQEDLLLPYLATYGKEMAIFNQEAPADTDRNWGRGPQYGRIVYAVDMQGDPERTIGGMLAVDILCDEDKQFPEEIEPIIRDLIHGYFFSNGTFTVAAQWKNSSYFTEPERHVTGCTVTFDLLAFPVITTPDPDVVALLNEWTAKIPGVHVINYKPLPAAAWKPSNGNSAVYWRRRSVKSAGWIPDTYQTVWRTATVKGHIFSETPAEVATLSEKLTMGLYAAKWIRKPKEGFIRVDRNNTTDDGADPLKTGQVTVEATYGVVVRFQTSETLDKINIDDVIHHDANEENEGSEIYVEGKTLVIKNARVYGDTLYID